MEETESRGNRETEELRNYAEDSFGERERERELDSEETADGPNEGMPKRRADRRPEHQT